MKLFGGKTDNPETPATEPEAGSDSIPPETQKAGVFSRMKQAVSRTRESLSFKIDGFVALSRTVDEQSLENL